MKKKIVQVISCFLSLLFLILTSTAVFAESSTPGNVSVDEWNDWNSRYFSFIYTTFVSYLLEKTIVLLHKFINNFKVFLKLDNDSDYPYKQYRIILKIENDSDYPYK